MFVIGSMIMGVADTCRTKQATGPIDSNWICEHPLSQLAQHSRIKGHFVTIFYVVRSRCCSV